MLTRRQFLARGAVGAGMLTVPSAAARAVPAAAAPPVTKLRRFTVPLPIPAKATPVSANTYHITQRQTEQTLHPRLGQTKVWGYDDGTLGPLYPGPTIEVQKGTPTTVSYENQLPTTHLLAVDTSIVPEQDATVRALSHLHGGFVSGADDGNPYHTGFEAEYRQGQTQTVTYPNDQPATTLWYHDHAVSITRLNVYAGLAGYYLIRDSDDTGLEPNPIGVPGGDYEIPIVLQDRTFTGDGELLYPPSWEPEFFGDTAVVNGAPFPFLEVEPRMYRFRFLNGSNSRFYNLDIAGGPPFHHIGSEGGMFDAPVQTSRILILPAERADVIVDFTGLEGRHLMLRNVRLPDGVVSPASPKLPQMMQFRVGSTVTSPGPTAIPTSLPGSLPSFGAPARERYITLEEVLDEDGEPIRSEINGLRFHDPTEIQVPAGDVEDWLLINLSADTHPIHLHLPQFEVVSRRPFDVEAYQEALEEAREEEPWEPNPDPAPYYTGGPLPPQADDLGFKDTVSANPGVVTRIRSPFELPPGVSGTQKYVFHCHILEHEDNDMMRPYEVVG